MNIPVIPQDKANHFIYGQCIFGLTLIGLGYLVNIPLHDALGWSMGVTTLLALAKEGRDRWLNRKDDAEGRPRNHSVEAWDAAATGLGGAFLWLVILLTWSV